MFLKSVKELFFDIVAPPYCEHCKQFLQTRSVLCDSCITLIQPVVSYPLHVTPKRVVSVFARGAYNGPLKKLILAKRYSNLLAASQLGQLLSEYSPVVPMQDSILVPIPLHWSRQAQRGYNQSAEIAKSFGKACSLPVEYLLRRHRKTKLQLELDPAARKHNLANAFSLATDQVRQDYQNKHIIIIDDLMTTGSTLKEAVRVLDKLKPASISAIVAARTVLD